MIPFFKKNNKQEKQIFYWDGKSSTANPDNITLWQKIVDEAKKETVLVYASDESNTIQSNRAVFIISPADITSSATKNLLSVATHYEGGQGQSNSGQIVNLYRATVTLTLSNFKVSNVSTIGQTNYSINFLSTSKTNSQFVPTTNDDPATKKYVDDKANLKTRLDGTTLYITNNGTNP